MLPIMYICLYIKNSLNMLIIKPYLKSKTYY